MKFGEAVMRGGGGGGLAYTLEHRSLHFPMKLTTKQLQCSLNLFFLEVISCVKTKKGAMMELGLVSDKIYKSFYRWRRPEPEGTYFISWKPGKDLVYGPSYPAAGKRRNRDAIVNKSGQTRSNGVKVQGKVKLSLGLIKLIMKMYGGVEV
jgi:hypothetical protein